MDDKNWHPFIPQKADRSLFPKGLIHMIDYEFSDVQVEYYRDRNSDKPYLWSSLTLVPNDEKLTLIYTERDTSITFSGYIEDWTDFVPKMIIEKMFANRRSKNDEVVYPGILKITGRRNPLIDLVIFAFCSEDNAELVVNFSSDSREIVEGMLASNGNLRLRSASKYSGLLTELMEAAHLHLPDHLDDQGRRLSSVLDLARKSIDYNEAASLKIQSYLLEHQQEVLFAKGRFVVARIGDPDVFDNVYDDRYEFAVIDLELEYLFGSLSRPTAMALGNKVEPERSRDYPYHFALAYSHCEWADSCKTIEEVPDLAFSMSASYSNLCRG